MSRARTLAALLAVSMLALAAGAGFGLWRYGLLAGDAREEGAAAVLAMRLPDLDGGAQPLAQWRGKVLVVNYWATWCAPCREEIPMFVRLQQRHGARGLQFVGIAIDQRDKTAEFAREFGINYPVLMGDIAAVELSRRAGNRAGALPFTLVFDRQGRLAATHLGDLKEAKLESLVLPLL